MARDPLDVLWRLREAAVTAASQGLANALAAEGLAAARLDDHAARMRRERDEAGPDEVAAFAAWLPHARQHAERLRAALCHAGEEVLRLQRVLTARKTEAEAVAKALKRRQAEAALTRGRREQAIMDEVAGRRR